MNATVNTYTLPVQPELVTQIVKDNESHKGAYEGSVDFAVPIGTFVFAAADGIVTRVRDDSDKYGKDISFGQDVNYITIKHVRNELSEYLHLAKSSSLVEPGQKVKQGQEIAKTGLSGWMFAPHLHFMVYNKVEGGQEFQCLDVQFSEPLPAFD